MTIQIRKAQPQDAPTLAEVVRDIGWFAHVNAEPPDATRERVAHHLALCLGDDSHTIYVAENADGEALGYVAVHWLPYLILAGPEGYISELFIKGAARGQGVGSQLLAAAEAEARQRGCLRLMLINMRQRESYQREFYKKQGWDERPEAVNFVRFLK
jgi:GNAT superfamily N-acetyltransferase